MKSEKDGVVAIACVALETGLKLCQVFYYYYVM